MLHLPQLTSSLGSLSGVIQEARRVSRLRHGAAEWPWGLAECLPDLLAYITAVQCLAHMVWRGGGSSVLAHLLDNRRRKEPGQDLGMCTEIGDAMLSSCLALGPGRTAAVLPTCTKRAPGPFS